MGWELSEKIGTDDGVNMTQSHMSDREVERFSREALTQPFDETNEAYFVIGLEPCLVKV